MKFAKAILPVALSLSAFLCADQKDTKKHQEHMYHKQHQNNLDERVITPSANPVVQHGLDIFLSADFIFWTGRLEGLSYAHTGYVLANEAGSAAFTNQSPAFNVPAGTTYYVNNKWSPGFKVGIGLALGHDGWDLGAEYTWFRTNTKSSVTGSSEIGKQLIPTSGFALTAYPEARDTAVIGDAEAKYRLHFNNIDLALGRSFFVSPRLTTRPHFGLKGTWQTQRFNPAFNNITSTATESQGDDNNGNPILVTNTLSNTCYHIENKQNYWGVGIRTGMDTSWQIVKCFGIYGNWALSALWGKFDVSRKDNCQYTYAAQEFEGPEDPEGEGTITTTTTTVPLSSMMFVQNQFHTLNAVLELALGVRYDYWFSDNDYRLRIQAGFEEQLWFNQNHFTKTYNPEINHYGNLVFQGLTIKAQFDF